MEVLMTKIIMQNQGRADKNDQKDGKDKTKRPFCFKRARDHGKGNSSRNLNL